MLSQMNDDNISSAKPLDFSTVPRSFHLLECCEIDWRIWMSTEPRMSQHAQATALPEEFGRHCCVRLLSETKRARTVTKSLDDTVSPRCLA